MQLETRNRNVYKILYLFYQSIKSYNLNSHGVKANTLIRFGQGFQLCKSRYQNYVIQYHKCRREREKRLSDGNR